MYLANNYGLAYQVLLAISGYTSVALVRVQYTLKNIQNRIL